MKEILIYALEAEDTEQWQEQLISSQCKTESDIRRVIAVAKADGWHSFRISHYNGEAPDFVSTIAKA